MTEWVAPHAWDAEARIWFCLICGWTAVGLTAIHVAVLAASETEGTMTDSAKLAAAAEQLEQMPDDEFIDGLTHIAMGFHPSGGTVAILARLMVLEAIRRIEARSANIVSDARRD